MHPGDRRDDDMTIILISAGLALLLAGGEAIVRGAAYLADRWGVPRFVVGVTVVGVGTSLPEAVVCVNAALAGAPGLAVGNIVGSNLVNSLLVIGLAALFLPFTIETQVLKRDVLFMSAATIAFVGIGLSGMLVRWHAAALLIMLVTYLVLMMRSASRGARVAATVDRDADAGIGPVRFNSGIAFVSIALGIACLTLGAEWLVEGAADLARSFNVSEEIIGLTVIAIGTSLPELATALVAAWRRQTDVCLGNVLGSNIFNLVGVAGVTGLFAPLPFSPQMIGFDLLVLLAAKILLVLFMISGRRISRLEGGTLAALYLVYVFLHFVW